MDLFTCLALGCIAAWLAFALCGEWLINIIAKWLKSDPYTHYMQGP
jgi:hypothetical protein